MITGDTLKRLQDALKGRTLSKNDLQAIVDNAIAAGVVPAKSLLTAHQKAAIKKRRTA